jgi:CTP synthase
MRHPADVIFIMVSYLPVPSKLGEMKTRPTQHAVHQLASYGVNTDIIIARADRPLDIRRKEKIATACNLSIDHVISAPDIESIYDVPVNFDHDHLADIVLTSLGFSVIKTTSAFSDWKKMARGIKDHGQDEIHIAIVGKYFATGKFSAYEIGVKAVIHAVNASDFEGASAPCSSLDEFDGIIVPGGFGEKGIEGKLNVIRYAREHGIPYFGLCYGMQLMTIEYARNILGLSGAHTAEIDPHASHLIIDIMPDQKKKIKEGDYGGSMRLGLYPAKLTKDSVAEEAYGSPQIKERHRHRYEVNPKYVSQLEKGGLVFSGKSPDGKLMEIAELPRSAHPFFLGTQFHPEFLARPLRPHPLFTEFIKAAKVKQRKR